MRIAEKVRKKLPALPDRPGVYLMRDRGGRIIYIGKALSLRQRVRSYFHRGTLRSAEPKLRGLIRSIADLDWLVLRTEAEATLTEGRMIKEYRPRFNILFKDDKRFLSLRVRLDDPFPRLETCRLQKNDGAVYFGPYASSAAAHCAQEFAEKHFGLRRCRPRVPGPEDHRHCLNDILRFCAAPCIGKVSPEQYRERVQAAVALLRGERPEILGALEEAMRREAAAQHYEKAAVLRDTLLLLRRAVKERRQVRRAFGLEQDTAQAGLEELRVALELDHVPRRIEAFDISNISGTLAVGSLVCAVDGMPAKPRYRLFRIRTVQGADDPGMIAEVIRRRFTRLAQERQPGPDLVLVDGGATQVRAARRELDRLGLAPLPVAGLAKRLEEIYQERDGAITVLRLPAETAALKILQALRDEAHRFALTYHRRLRLRRLRESVLDDIEGIGPTRKELLLKKFGSVARLRHAPAEAIAAVPGIGPQLAQAIRSALGPLPGPASPAPQPA